MLKNASNLNILGIRGVPAAHGGFETFAENFARFLVGEGWNVTVYCQAEKSPSTKPREDIWEGIRRVHIQTLTKGSIGTIEFDLRCTLDVLQRPGVDLVLGYNTAFLVALQRLLGRAVIINMDGLEWKRAKWGRLARLWFWWNEGLGLRLASQAIADHPLIAEHLIRRGGRRLAVIPYGANSIQGSQPDLIKRYGLLPREYFLVIARPEPENSILEIVQAYKLAKLPKKLVVLGNYKPDSNAYHAEVLRSAGPDVIFPGAIYDQDVVASLREHSTAYIHGHQVGGTNPSLVESLGASSAVIAHANGFNRWVAGPKQLYFDSVEACADHMSNLSSNPELGIAMRTAAKEQYKRQFALSAIHHAYLEQVIRVAETHLGHQK